MKGIDREIMRRMKGMKKRASNVRLSEEERIRIEMFEAGTTASKGKARKKGGRDDAKR